MGVRLNNARSLYLEAIRDGNPAVAIAKYSGDRYAQVEVRGIDDGTVRKCRRVQMACPA